MTQSFVRFLGARGSMPVTGPSYEKYGGNTSCVFLSLGGQNVLFDAGSGLLQVSPALLGQTHKVSLLLSHSHIDHLIGLPFAPLLFERSMEVDIYGASRGGKTVKEQIECLLAPPLWPVGFESFLAKVHCHEAKAEFWLGDVHVQTMAAEHPGGCSIFRLEYQGKSLVYATDNELLAQSKDAFVQFAKGCTLLICDGQYSEQEYEEKIGFGHTRWDVAVHAALECACEQFVIFHHDPSSTDEMLDAVQQEIWALTPRGFLAKEDMVIEL